MIQIQVFN